MTLLSKTLIGLILDSTGGVDGRKKLQKITFLTNSIGWNALDDFRFYHYGPYSDSLLSEISELELQGLVSIRKSPHFDWESYFHSLTDLGRSSLIKLQENVNINRELVAKTKGMVKELNEFSSEQLEVMASLLFLKLARPLSNKKTLILRLKLLKSHLSNQTIEKGFKVFKIMKKYKTVRKLA